MNVNLNIPPVTYQDIPIDNKDIMLRMARLDLLHPVVSGNKIYKLHYFLEEATRNGNKTLLTFGGAYSNHLVATAFTAQQSGLSSIGIVRGEKPAKESHTLMKCREYGMALEFISREKYSRINETDYLQALHDRFDPCIIIPEGGSHLLGAMGAKLICTEERIRNSSHICTATGTATTLAGIISGAPDSTVVSVPVIKNMTDIHERVNFLNKRKAENLQVFDNYSFGGYAKFSAPLMEFMNMFYNRYQIPLDFVYTGKLMYAVMEQITLGSFAPGSTIMCLHTGGLQGNLSLPEGLLVY